MSDPRIKQGRALLDAKRYDDAITYFGELLQLSSGSSGDDLSMHLGPLYYEYGNALLRKAEDGTNIFGETVQQAEQDKLEKSTQAADAGGAGEGSSSATPSASSPMAVASSPAAPSSSEADSSEETPANGALPENAEEGDEDGVRAAMVKSMVAQREQDEDDMECAWENLEAARLVYSKGDKSSANLTALGRVLLRLGDLSMLNGQFTQAVQDFSGCLTGEEEGPRPPNGERGMAEAHYELALAHIYASSTEGMGADEKRQHTADALANYEKSAAFFGKVIEALQKAKAVEGDAGNEQVNGKGKAQPNSASTAGVKEVNELEELIDIRDTIMETIATAKSGAEQEALQSLKEPQTVIGFGGPTVPAAEKGKAQEASSKGTLLVAKKKKRSPESNTEQGKKAKTDPTG